MSNQEHKVTETLQKYYDKVFQDGKLVNIHIGMWGMSHKLNEEDIKINNKLPDTIKLGKKMLIKDSVYNTFKTLEQKIRNYLYNNSFSFPLVSQAHFVPKTRYLEVQKKLEEFKEQYMRLANEFFDNYENYKQQALDFYDQHKDTVSVELAPYYPPLADIKKKFYMDIFSYEISLPTVFGEVDIHDEIEREKIHDEVKSQVSQQYQQDYRKQVDSHMSKIGEFVGEVTSTLREKIVEHCSVALEKINEKQVVSNKSINTLLKHIQNFRDMNFVDDKTIEDELNKVEGLIKTQKDFTTDKNAVELLRQRLNDVVTEAKSLSDVADVSGKYFRRIKV